MNRVLRHTLFFFTLSFAACNKQPAVTPAETPPVTANAQAAPSAAPSVSPTVVAPTLAMPAPGSSVLPPGIPNPKDGSKQAKSEPKALPPDLWQRMTRPLTLEEINRLPPETRDMILRAQGRLPASPAPKKK